MSFLLNVWFQKKKKKKKNREKKRKKETPYSLDKLRLSFNDFFFFLFHDSWRNMVYTMLSYRQQQGDTMQMKSNFFLRIMLLINYMMEENLFVNVE